MPKKKLSAVEWLEEISLGLQYRRQYGLEDHWYLLESIFYHTDAPRQAAGPNLIASTGDSLVSALDISYPYINVKPMREAFVGSAPILESIDNWLLRELKVKRAMSRAMLHNYLWGHGIVKIGYDSQFGFDSKFDIGEDDPVGITFTMFDRKNNLIENGSNDPGMPWVSAVKPHDFVVPWGTIDLEDAGWCAHRVVRHIDDIKSDPKYRNCKDLRPTMSMEDFTRSYTTVQKTYKLGRNLTRSSAEEVGKAEFVEMWEIHNKLTREILVVATGCRGFLRETTNELQIDGLPFVDMTFIPRARTFWVTPTAYYLRDSQAEMDDISLQASNQRRMTSLKFLYEEGTIDETDLEKAMSSTTGLGIKFRAGTDIKKSFDKLHNENQSSLYQDADIIRRNAREISGMSRNQSGEFETGRRTAEEARIVSRGALSRLGRRQNVLRTAYEEVMRKINQVIFKFWKSERMIEYLGNEDAKKWVEYTGSSIKGEYMYELVFGDEVLPTQGNDKNETLQLYAQLAADPNVDLQALRHYLAKSSNDPNFTGLFKVQTQAPPISEGNENAAVPV